MNIHSGVEVWLREIKIGTYGNHHSSHPCLWLQLESKAVMKQKNFKKKHAYQRKSNTQLKKRLMSPWRGNPKRDFLNQQLLAGNWKSRTVFPPFSSKTYFVTACLCLWFIWFGGFFFRTFGPNGDDTWEYVGYIPRANEINCSNPTRTFNEI